MMESAAIEKPALTYPFIVILVHVPGIDLSQARAKGCIGRLMHRMWRSCNLR